MNASNVDQALTRPVALRRKSAGRDAEDDPIVASAMLFSSHSLLAYGSAVDELVTLDALTGIEQHYRRHKHSFLIRAAGVDRERLAELHRSLAVVDVTVQRH